MRLCKPVLLGTLILNLFGCGGDFTPEALSRTSVKKSVGVIYGKDSVEEVVSVNTNSEASVALISLDKWRALQAGEKLDTVDEVYGTGDQLKWGAQESVAFCSGAVVAPDLILTAGHCFTEEHTCENTVFVMGYQERSSVEVERRGVLCKEIVHMRDDFERGYDFALVRVAEVMKVQSVILKPTPVKVGESLYSIGYPLGSYKKKSRGLVREIREDSGMIVSNLDVFEGNSGSPVFSAATHELVGILSSGEADFEESQDASAAPKLRHCSDDSCTGEFIIPLEKIVADIPKQK